VLAGLLQVHQRDQGGTGMGHGARATPLFSALGVSRGWREGGAPAATVSLLIPAVSSDPRLRR
jgi:hypothetical protein